MAAPNAASSSSAPSPPADLAAPPANAAPPEPIPPELKAVEQAFVAAGNARFLDLSGRFTFEERSQLNKGVAELAEKTRAKVYVLALPGKTDVATFAAIHGDLKLATRDVLLIFSADKRHLHSQAIPKTAGTEILKNTNQAFYKSQSTGVLAMIKEIEARLASSTTATTTTAPVVPPAPAKKSGIPSEYLLLAVAALVIAFALYRTSKKPAPKNTARKS